MKKIPVRLVDEQADEPAIAHDLRVLVEANRKLREELSDLVSHRPRADLRAHVDEQRRQQGRRRASRTAPAPRARRKVR